MMMDDQYHNTTQTKNTSIRIWQQNLNKSATAQQHFLHNLDPAKYDIAAIQEPAINCVNLTTANSKWNVIYPSTHNKANAKRTRSVLFVNKKISKDGWRILPLESPDITGIELLSEQGNIRLYNIYNDGNHQDTLTFFSQHLTSIHANTNDTTATNLGMIILGDFNRHHPMWDDPKNHHLFMSSNLIAAQPLLNILATYDLRMTLPPSIPTLQANATKNLTRPDNVFCSNNIHWHETITRCEVAEYLTPVNTDHFPILTECTITPELTNSPPRYNYRMADWEKFGKKLTTQLQQIPQPKRITNTQQAENCLRRLNDALINTIHETIPLTKPSPYAKRWWNNDLARENKRLKTLSHASQAKRQTRNHPIHQEYSIARNKFASQVEKAKLDHWNDYLEEVDQSGIWNTHKYLVDEPEDHFHSRIPTLRKTNTDQHPPTQTNGDKSKLFYGAFFKPQRDPDPSITEATYPEPSCDFQNITNDQIHRTIKKLSPYKAPGPNGVYNIVFIKNANALVPYLGHIFRATFNLKWYPEQWKTSTTVVLRKPGRPDYSLPKAYRPIALLDTMAKILSSCVADDLTYISETHNLLPNTHFGGRPGRSTVDSLHLLTKFTHDAWAHPQEKYVSMLFLDVKAAFPSVVIPQLLHNMRLRGIPKEYTEWYERRLQNRTTILSFDDYTSDPFNIPTGLDQGCPISPVAFLFYNAALIDLTGNGEKDQISLGFIDDTAFITRGRSFEEANAKLKHLMEKDDGALAWSQSHHAEFELDKTALICATRSRKPDEQNPGKTIPTPRPTITIQGTTVQPSNSYKFLGVIIDQELRFAEHAAYAIGKGTKYVLACKRLTRPSKGTRTQMMKKLYEGVAIPKMLYAADVWAATHINRGKGSKQKGWGARGFIKKIETVQRTAALAITGGMSSTATDLLFAHADLLPIPVLLRQHCQRAALRLVTIPPKHPLHCHTTQAARQRRHHKSPLHQLLQEFPLHPRDFETIQQTRYSPKWKPPIKTDIRDKNAAIEKDTQSEETQDAVLYSDGSGHNGRIGGAAIMRKAGQQVSSLRFELGPDTHHTVYEGEIVGMILAIELLKRSRKIRSTSLALDNKAAIIATQSFSSQPGHYLIDIFHKNLQHALKKHQLKRLPIRWVPGHSDVPGNEAADREAKEAASGNTSDTTLLPRKLRTRKNQPRQLPRSKSAAKQQLQGDLKKLHHEIFRTSPRAQLANSIDSSLPSKNFLKLIADLPRRQASLIFQMRTGHIPLNSHLYRIGKSPTPACPHCPDKRETVPHYILFCPTYATQRTKLIDKTKRKARDIGALLSDRNCIKPFLTYAHATKRFEKSFGNLLPPPDTN